MSQIALVFGSVVCLTVCLLGVAIAIVGVSVSIGSLTKEVHEIKERLLKP